MIYKDLNELLNSLEGILKINKDGLEILNKEKVVSDIIDELAYNAALNENKDLKDISCWLIREIAYDFDIIPSSIQNLYEARSRNEYKDITIPAINLRGLTYDLAKALIRTAKRNNSLSFIFEIAKSEIGYTQQRPAEYVALVLAAAIKEHFEGPIFIQADHVQVKDKNFKEDRDKEINNLKELIEEEIEAGFYNIDIDSSTLVDLNKKEVLEQQRLNFEIAAELTSFIREKQPEGITISVGGEIGEVGGKNSTPEELRAFMEGYLRRLKDYGSQLKGISKISIQTGTAHGGVVLPDGSVAKVKVDFDTLRNLSEIARKEYGLSGAVQHGASTLPAELFGRFPETQTVEIHLATEFQNIIYESKHLPDELRQKMYNYIKTELRNERKEDQTEDQFIYKTRKKAFGPFKKELLDLPDEVKEAISREVEEKFDFLFKKLNSVNTKELVNKYIKPQRIKAKVPHKLTELI